MTAQLSVRFIAETVAQAFGASYLRVISDSRAPDVIAARQVSAWLAWRHTTLSKAEIGRLLGGRSDVAVIHQIERIEERRAADPAFAAEVDAAEVAVLAAADALRRLAVDAPPDPDPVALAERILSGRAVDVPADGLRALAMAALGRATAPEGAPDAGQVDAVIRSGRTLLAALDRCNAAPPGTPPYGRAAVARSSAVHGFREALRPFAADGRENQERRDDMSITAERVNSMADPGSQSGASILTKLQDDAIVTIGGNATMRDAKGRYVPLALVKPTDKLQDELVRKMIAFAVDLSEQIARFRGHCFDDLGSFQALIAQEHGAAVGGAKGNVTLTSFDGTMKVQFQVADLLDFGPELQAAKALVDECLNEWTEGSRDEVRAIVQRAFNVDREGRINRAELFMLLRVAIEEPRWKRAMEALRASIRVIGSKTYIRFYKRAAADAKWQPVSIDLASAGGGP